MTARNRALTTSLTIRLPHPLAKRVKQRAAAQRRKVSDYVRLLLEASDQPQTADADAVDPHAQPSGTPSTRA